VNKRHKLHEIVLHTSLKVQYNVLMKGARQDEGRALDQRQLFIANGFLSINKATAPFSGQPSFRA